MNAIARNALSAYSQVDMEVNVAVASPYKLILLLFDGALKAISVAKFTVACTPGTRFRTFSIRAAQAVQVMPVSPSSTCSRAAGEAPAAISPRPATMA